MTYLTVHKNKSLHKQLSGALKESGIQESKKITQE